MLLVLWAILAAVLLFYLAIPLLIKKTQTLPVALSNPQELAPDVQDAFGEQVIQWRAQLQQLGFVRCSSSMLANGQVDSHYSLYKRADDNAAVMLVSMVNRSNAQLLHYVDFVQPYVDGSSLLVNNSPIASAYPPTPTKLMLRLPEQQGVAELWSLFCALRQALAVGRLEQVWRADEAQQLVAKALLTEAQELAARGYCELRVGETVATLTLKGAYYMTWKLLPPFKQLARRAEQRRRERLLAQLTARPM